MPLPVADRSPPGNRVRVAVRNFTPETDVDGFVGDFVLLAADCGTVVGRSGIVHQGVPLSAANAARIRSSVRGRSHDHKVVYHFDPTPFSHAAISGLGALAPEGRKGSQQEPWRGPMAPMEMIETYSADAVRYWAASTGFGKDSVISEAKIQTGTKLVTKLWNVARFAARFVTPGTLETYRTRLQETEIYLTPADRWILARTGQLLMTVTERLDDYDYAAAKSEIEGFFWQVLTDNYLEMAKLRLYGQDEEAQAGAARTLQYVLAVVVRLLAPFIPHVKRRSRLLFAEEPWTSSIHRAPWPASASQWVSADAAARGEQLVAIATAVRRYKSERGLSLGAELAALVLVPGTGVLREGLAAATLDLRSVTRAEVVTMDVTEPEGVTPVLEAEGLWAGVVSGESG